ncbi:MAG: SpoIIE family protein phosphatase [Candidatus Riflebacteria bacterium]|nr:SpoIIE family protein phosphatase [Candidatus Riflebacteria bacterium]
MDRRSSLKRFLYAFSITFFLCGFPLLVGNIALKYLLDLKLVNDERDRFERMDSRILHVLPFCNAEAFLKPLLKKLGQRAEKAQDPVSFLKKVLPHYEKKFPNLFTFMIFDEKDRLIDFGKDPTSRTISEKLLETLRFVYKTGEKPAVLDEKNPQSKYFLSFLGLLGGGKDKILRVLKLGSGWMPCSDSPIKTWFFHHISDKFSFFAQIHGRGFSPIVGLMPFILRKSGDNIQLSLVDMNTMKVAGTKENVDIVQKAAVQFEREPQNNLIIKNKLVSIASINSRYRLTAFSENDIAEFSKMASKVFFFLSFLILISGGFFIYIILSEKQLPFISIRGKLIALFLLSSALPLGILAFTVIAYLGEREKSLTNDSQQHSEKVLRELDTKFPLAGRVCEIGLKELVKRTDLSTPQGLEQFKIDIDKFATLYRNKSGTILINRSGKMIPVDSSWNDEVKKLLGTLLYYVFTEYCINENAEPIKPMSLKKSAILSGIAGVDPEILAYDLLGKEGMMSPLEVGPIKYYAMYNLIRSPDGKPTHIMGICWKKSMMYRLHLQRSLPFRPLEDGTELLAVRTDAFYQKKKDLKPSDPRRVFRFRQIFPGIPNKPLGRKFIKFFRTFLFSKRIAHRIMLYKNEPYIVTGFPGGFLENYILFALKPLSPIKSEIKYLKFQLIVFGFLSLGFTSLLGIFLSRKFLQPIQELTKGIDELRDRRFSYRIPQQDNDEFGVLANQFNKMAESLSEINMGREVQERLFPAQVLEYGNYKVFGYSKPASELGGDYFDYLRVGKNNLLVLTGDVTGHGIPAAIVMAMVKTIVVTSANSEATPVSILSSLNKILHSTVNLGWSKKLLMTLSSVWIDTSNDQINIYNCGHPFPYKRKVDGTFEEIEIIGTILGIREKQVFTPVQVELQPSERLIFYTDGLAEPLGEEGVSGFNILKSYLAGRPFLPLEEACKDILENHPLIASGQPLPDDFTVVIIERS